MSYHRGGLPAEFVPPPVVEPLTPERFMDLLGAFVDAGTKQTLDKARAELADAVKELFRRLAE